MCPNPLWRSAASLVVGLLAAGLLGFALGRSTGGSDASGSSTSLVASSADGDGADGQAEFDEAITRAQQKLGAGGVAEAYDLLLVAARLRPSDPLLFDSVIAFIERASGSEDESHRLFAEELFARAETLIPYQPTAAVSDARQRYDALATRLEPTHPLPAIDPFSAVEQLIAAAQQSTVPLRIRHQALDQARTELDSLYLASLAAANGDGLPPSFTERHVELSGVLEKIEASIVAHLFANAKQPADKWLTESASTLSACDSAPPDKLRGLADRLKQQIEEGLDIQRDLAPYSDSGVAGAPESVTSVEKRIAVMQRTRTWLYNQQVLRLIRNVEGDGDLPGMQALQSLAEVHEDQLEPYVLRRHNAAWDKRFNDLPTDEDKAQAVKLRILNGKE